MVNIAANMTQVLTQSPQVTSLVAGEAASADQVNRINRLEESRRFEEQMKSTVASTEHSVKLGESEEETRRRAAERNARPAIEEERERRRRARAALGTGAAEENSAPASSGCALSPFESKQVIDVCV